MSEYLAKFPAPFLNPKYLKDSSRNRESMDIAWGNCKAYGYLPQSTGYGGSEVHWEDLLCLICGQVVANTFYSWVRRGASHKPVETVNADGTVTKTPCTYKGKPVRGKAQRQAIVTELNGGVPVAAPGSQEFRNGAGGMLGQVGEVAPVDEKEAAEATEATVSVRTVAVEDAAKSRPAPAPQTEPPKNSQAPRMSALPTLGADARQALRTVALNPGNVEAHGSNAPWMKRIDIGATSVLTGRGCIRRSTEAVSRTAKGYPIYVWEMTGLGLRVFEMYEQA